jgi:hypothetical protein
VHRGGEAREAGVVDRAVRCENQRDQALVEMMAQGGLSRGAMKGAAEGIERIVGEFLVLRPELRDVLHHQRFEDDARLVYGIRTNRADAPCVVDVTDKRCVETAALAAVPVPRATPEQRQDFLAERLRDGDARHRKRFG